MSQYTIIPDSSIDSNPSLSLPPILSMHVTPSGSQMGKLGEDYTLRLLEKSGYIAEKIAKSDFQVTCPATGETWKLEVKTARVRSDRKYVFHLLDLPYKDYRNSDVLLLLAVVKAGYPVPFVIPTAHIDPRATIVITSHPQTYRGRWSQYRQTQHQINLAIQSPFFNDVESV